MPETRSFRIPDELIERIDEYAEAHAYSRTGALVVLVSAGLEAMGERDESLLERLVAAGLEQLPAEDAEQVRSALRRALKPSGKRTRPWQKR